MKARRSGAGGVGARGPGARRSRSARGLVACALAATLLGGAPVGSQPRATESTPLFLSAAEQGPWLAADKELHFAGSLAIAASLRVEGRTRREAVAGALGLGLIKEAYDATLKPRRLKRGASVKDLAADLAGALAGILVLGALER